MPIAKHSELRIDLEERECVLHGTPAEAAGTMMRGTLRLHLVEATKIKSVTLNFTGKMRVSWADGVGSSQRFHREERTVISHKWLFVPSSKKGYLLPAGDHEWPFEFALPGNLPESVEGSDYGEVIYRLKALADRPTFSANFTNKVDVRLARALLPSSTNYGQSMTIANEWANKLVYEIMVPSKVFGEGDTIPILFKLQPLCPALKVRWLTCTLKEYRSFFSGDAQKSQTHVVRHIRDEDFSCAGTVWEKTEIVSLLSKYGRVLCDTDNDMMKIKHKLKFTISLANRDGHVSELRAAMPIIISAAKNNDDSNFLPAYEDSWRTLPYNPSTLAQLRERVNRSQASRSRSTDPSFAVLASAGSSRSSSRAVPPLHAIENTTLSNNTFFPPSTLPSYRSVVGDHNPACSTSLPSYESTGPREDESMYIKPHTPFEMAH